MSNFNAEGATDYIMHRARLTPINAPRMVASTPPRIIACEYCGRGAYLSEGLTCKGCGGPLPCERRDAPPMMISSDVLGAETLWALGLPSACIPVNIPSRSRLSDFVTGIGGVVALMFGRGF